ncbi:MAG: TraM recognition domain-containing protein, partial [Acidobacteriota bacterium]|nr:TraM recognition domain-containing protein [Acidobacteriota bacterium]
VVEETTVPVMFVVDEAAHVPVANLKELPGVGRGRRFAVMLFYQNLSQGYDMYGEHGFNAILGSINTKTFLPGCDHVTARYASEIVGQTTVWGRGFDDAPGTENDKLRSTEASRALIDPNEVRQLPVHRQAITVIETMPPVKWTYPKSAKEPPRVMPRKYGTPRIVNFPDAERESLKRKLLTAAQGESGQHVEEVATQTAEQTPPPEIADESPAVAIPAAVASMKQSISNAANETVAREQEPNEGGPMVLSKTISPETVYVMTREAIDHLADLYDDPLPASSPDVQIFAVTENSLDRVLNP